MLSTQELSLMAKVMRHLGVCACPNARVLAGQVGTLIENEMAQRESIAENKSANKGKRRGALGQYYLVDISNGQSAWCRGLTAAHEFVALTLAQVETRNGGVAPPLNSFRTTMSTKGYWQRDLYADGLDQQLLCRKATPAETAELAADPSPFASPQSLLAGPLRL